MADVSMRIWLLCAGDRRADEEGDSDIGAGATVAQLSKDTAATSTRAREEIQWKARRLHCAATHTAKTDEEDSPKEQAETSPQVRHGVYGVLDFGEWLKLMSDRLFTNDLKHLFICWPPKAQNGALFCFMKLD